MGTIAKPKVKVKRQLRRRGITYGEVARFAGVSWYMVWAVINGYKVSNRVMEAIHRLLGDGNAT